MEDGRLPVFFDVRLPYQPLKPGHLPPPLYTQRLRQIKDLPQKWEIRLYMYSIFKMLAFSEPERLEYLPDAVFQLE